MKLKRTTTSGMMRRDADTTMVGLASDAKDMIGWWQGVIVVDVMDGVGQQQLHSIKELRPK